jgi:hypothetical protein
LFRKSRGRAQIAVRTHDFVLIGYYFLHKAAI